MECLFWLLYSFYGLYILHIHVLMSVNTVYIFMLNCNKIAFLVLSSIVGYHTLKTLLNLVITDQFAKVLSIVLLFTLIFFYIKTQITDIFPARQVLSVTSF